MSCWCGDDCQRGRDGFEPVQPPPPPKRSTQYLVGLSCQRCGGEVVHVNATPASSVHAVAVCRCVACDRQWELYLTMVSHAGWDNAAKERERKARLRAEKRDLIHSGNTALVSGSSQGTLRTMTA